MDAKKDDTNPADVEKTQADDTTSQDAASAEGTEEDSETTAAEELDEDTQPVEPEAQETGYLVGGEVPVNAPGTEGMAREYR